MYLKIRYSKSKNERKLKEEEEEKIRREIAKLKEEEAKD